MVLQLNPDVPLVWRSPTTMQFGVESPLVRLHDVSPAQERLIAALVHGATRPGLKLIANTAQASDAEVTELLELLDPVLGRAAAPVSGTVSIIGTTPTAARLRSTVAAAGLTLTAPDDRAELGLMVCHYVVEPQLFGYWLSRDIPHLPIVFTDTGVNVGPFIEPGTGPCLYCLERHRTDADPAWPAIASQLWGRTSPVEVPQLTNEVAALATRLLTRRLSAPASEVATSVFLDAATGETTNRQWAQHPACGCAALPGNDSAPGRQSAPAPTATRTGAAASVLA
jgi:bacteriocin biosynthesis cyclodehydratase domain-containing protein